MFGDDRRNGFYKTNRNPKRREERCAEMTTKQLDSQYIAATYKRADVFSRTARALFYTTRTGKGYIDLGAASRSTASASPTMSGRRPSTAQLSKIQHISNLYYTQPQAQLAQMLAKSRNEKGLFFSNSGAESNECLIQTARKYSSDKYGEGRSTIIALHNSFHGRTVTTLSATGQESYHKDFGPFTPGFVFAHPDDFDGWRRLFRRIPAAPS